MMRNLSVALVAVSAVEAYTSNNAVMQPGNENLPAETGGFKRMELDADLPVVNVKYRFPNTEMGGVLGQFEDQAAFDGRVDVLMNRMHGASFLSKSNGDDIMTAASGAAPTAVGEDTSDVSSVLNSLGAPPAQPAPWNSFLGVQNVGSQIGDVLRESGKSSAFRDAYAKNVVDQETVVVNPALEAVVRSANAKTSFLGGLRLRLQENSNTASSILSEELRDQRRQLTDMERKYFSFLADNEAKNSFLSLGGIASDFQRESASINAVRGDIGTLTSAVSAGGYTAYKAMSALLSLAADPNARLAMNASPKLLFNLKDLMKRESTSDQSRILAGSIISMITNLPVVSEFADKNSGSYGHVNIVLPAPSRVYAPDMEAIALSAGARPMDTPAGNYYA